MTTSSNRCIQQPIEKAALAKRQAQGTASVQCSAPVLSHALSLFGSSVTRARRRKGLSRKALAEAVGVSLNTIARLEQGKPGTALGHVFAVLYVLGDIEKVHCFLHPEP